MMKNIAKSYSNYQDLLKTIALIAMVMDHAALFMSLSDGYWMRAIGRGVMPIFCFYAGYNFTKPRHIIGLLGIVLTFIAILSAAFEGTTLNLLGMIYLGQWYLYFIGKWKFNSEAKTLMQCFMLLILAPFARYALDYGTIGIAFMVVGKIAGEGKEYRSFMPLLGISAMIFCMLDYAEYFSVADIALTSLIMFSTCLALSLLNHRAPISLNLKLISRNSLWIYFVNYSGHLLWFYHTYTSLL